MDNALILSASPHIHSGRTSSSIMRDVLIALIPSVIAGTVIFGFRALLVISVCVVSCILLEALYCIITKKEVTIGDLSAAVTGLLLGLNLPVSIPLWQCVIGCVFAIIIVKCLFGGIGCNPVNPAMTARVFMLVSFGSMAVSGVPVITDASAGATPLAMMADGIRPRIKDVFLGLTGGAIGETCALALIIGFVYLLIRRVITWHIPVSFASSVFILSLITEGFSITASLISILSGGLLLGAVFMATDYTTSPPTPRGKIVFGIGAGLITFVIRSFGIYPEGVSFAILFMNILNPYIERLTSHKIFGVKKV